MHPGPEFADAALVLAAHGSSVNADSATPARHQASELRRQGWFGQVEVGFWKQEPDFRSVVADLNQSRVFIVPLMMSDRYFAGNVFPRALGFPEQGRAGAGRVRRRGDQVLHYCQPVGTHALMTDLLLEHARALVAGSPEPPPPGETALFVAGHGTRRDPRSRRAVEDQARRLRDTGGYAAVQAVFLEETPRIADVYDLSDRLNLIVVPFFVSDGLHTAEDMPILLGEAEAVVRERIERGEAPWRNPTDRRGKRVWCGSGIGRDSGVAAIILERAREAARAADGLLGAPPARSKAGPQRIRGLAGR